MIKPPDDIKSQIDAMIEELRQHYWADPECEQLRDRILHFLRSVASPQADAGAGDTVKDQSAA